MIILAKIKIENISRVYSNKSTLQYILVTEAADKMKSRALNSFLVVGVVVVAFLAATFAQDDAPTEAEREVLEATNKAAEGAKNAAHKGADAVDKAADRISSRVEHATSKAKEDAKNAAHKGAEMVDKAAERVSGRVEHATSKAMEGAKNAAHKGAEIVDKAADGITVRVDRFVNPQPHQPGQSNVLTSAVGGLGRLARNHTVEAARAINDVRGATMNLVKHTAGATIQTVKEAATRVATMFRKPQSSTNDAAASSSSEQLSRST